MVKRKTNEGGFWIVFLRMYYIIFPDFRAPWLSFLSLLTNIYLAQDNVDFDHYSSFKYLHFNKSRTLDKSISLNVYIIE